MCASGKLSQPPVDQNRPHGHTAGEALGQAHQVGLQVVVLAGKHPTGASEASLDLVDDEKHSPLATERLHAA